MKGMGASYPWAKILALLLLLTYLPVIASADDAGITIEDLKIPAEGVSQILTMKDGSSLIGRITEVGLTEIKFQTDMGELTIHISKIKGIKDIPAESIRGGKYWFANPNDTRLFFSPTARTLKKGSAYFSDIYLFFPSIAYGVTDRITLGGGISIFPGVDMDNQIIYLTPKVSLVHSEKTNIAMAALIMKPPDVDLDDDDNDEVNTPFVGLVYGLGTLGKPDASLTFGLGYGFVDDDLSDKPMLIIGGEKRLGRRISFVSENWLIPGVDQPLISYGLRFFGEGLSIDLALLSPLGEDFFFPGFPYIDFVFNF